MLRNRRLQKMVILQFSLEKFNNLYNVAYQVINPNNYLMLQGVNGSEIQLTLLAAYYLCFAGSVNECSKQQRLNFQYLKGTLWVSFAKVRVEKLKLPTLWKDFLQDILAVQYEDLAIGRHAHIYIYNVHLSKDHCY